MLFLKCHAEPDALFVFRNPQEDDLPDLMYQCAFSIVGTVCMSNLVGFGIMDLRSFLGNAGLCGFGFGEVPENRELSEEARKIIDHTYTIMDDEDADKSYIVFSAGDVSLMDVSDAASAADHEQNTVYGLGYYNESMKGKRIMVLSRIGAL